MRLIVLFGDFRDEKISQRDDISSLSFQTATFCKIQDALEESSAQMVMCGQAR